MMIDSRRSKKPPLSMMNIRKVLMIIGGLLLVAAGITYLMLLQADRRTMAEVRAATDESARAPVVDSRVSGQVTEGSIDQSNASSATTKSAAIAEPPVAPVPAVTSLSQPAHAHAAPQPKLEGQSTAVASVNVQRSGAPTVVPTQRGRDRVDRHAMSAQGATQGATPETDELVRESAKLDPSLPPPDMFAVRSAADQSSAKPGKGSSPVAAAMTDQLVRESAKVDSAPAPK